MTLGFLHTAEAHVARFDGLLAERAPGVKALHRVAAPLLQRAVEAGGVTPDVVTDLRGRLDGLIDAGASVVLCTCSTLGGAAEQHDARVLRVDRPMAEAAVAAGGRIAVIAAVESTLEPTCALLRSVADTAETDVELEPLLSRDAWPCFERGDTDAYLDAIAETARTAAPGRSAVVLAQVSMADAVDRLTGISAPVLSSPRSGLEAALAAHGS